MTLVSVVIPCYNSEVHLTSTLESVMRQRGQFEIVAIDDGSNDDTTKILERFGNGIQIFKNGENKGHLGIAAIYNYGFRQARGEFVAVLDHDDELEKDKSLETRVRFLTEHPQVVCVFGSHYRIDERGAVIGRKQYQDDTGIVDNDLLMKRIIWHILFPFSHSSVMYRKSVFEEVGYYNPVHFGGEGEYMFKLASLGNQIGYISEPVVRYRITDSSASSKSSVKTTLKHCIPFIDEVVPRAEHPLLNPSIKGYRVGIDIGKDLYKTFFGKRVFRTLRTLPSA